MKRYTQTLYSAAICALLFVLCGANTYAQKLNNIQEAGVRSPANIKVDGKLNEWNDTFQAYNKTTNIYYTMANDDANLYLMMRSTDQANNNKIIGGGINLTINTTGKKTEKEAFTLIFPVVNVATLRANMMQMMRGQGGQAPDSEMIASMRKKAISTFKEIKLVGFKDIADSVISIYNEYGIKGYVDFDNKGALVIEMAVPLKELGLSPDKANAFSYNVKLNGINLNAIMPGMGAMMMGGGGGSFGGGSPGAPSPQVTVMRVENVGGSSSGMPRNMGDIANMLSPTDFWGKYTLVKK